MNEIVYDYTINGAQFRTKKSNIIEAFDEINNRVKLTYDSKSIDIRVAIYKNEELTKKCRGVKTLSLEEIAPYHNNKDIVYFKTYTGDEFEGLICDVIPNHKKVFIGEWYFIQKERVERFKNLTISEMESKLDKIGTKINIFDIVEIRLI